MKKIAMMLACVMTLAALAGCGASNGGNGTTGGTDAVKAPEGTSAELIDKIYENVTVDLPVDTMPIDLNDEYLRSSLLGVETPDGIKEASASESMMGAHAYSLVVARANSPEEADKLADTMMKNINTAKWVCVEATEKQAVVCGDVVMFIMLKPEYDVTTDQVVDAFTTVCGGNVSRVIK